MERLTRFLLEDEQRDHWRTSLAKLKRASPSLYRPIESLECSLQRGDPDGDMPPTSQGQIGDDRPQPTACGGSAVLQPATKRSEIL